MMRYSLTADTIKMSPFYVFQKARHLVCYIIQKRLERKAGSEKAGKLKEFSIQNASSSDIYVRVQLLYYL